MRTGDGGRCGQAAAEKLEVNGYISPANDGLIPGNTQSYVMTALAVSAPPYIRKIKRRANAD
jgi:hypothetical protein